MSLLGDRADVNCVTDKCASPLRDHEFLPSNFAPTPSGTCLDRCYLTVFPTAVLIHTKLESNTFSFSQLSVLLQVEYAPRAAWSGHPAEQRHECNRTERFLVDALLLAREANQLLLAFGADRNE